MNTLDGGYAHPEMLVETDWLENHLDDENIVIVDTEQQDSFRRAYRRGHIPRAVSVIDPHLKDPDDPQHVLAPDKFAREMSALGIDSDTLVVVYDCHRNLYSTRLWYLLNLYGHNRVRVLNGGWNKWCKEGRPITIKPFSNPPKKFIPKVNESFRRRVDYIKECLGETGMIILDVRGVSEYHPGFKAIKVPQPVPNASQNIPFPPTKRKGHIPGALHLEDNYVENHDVLEDAIWTFRPAMELREMFQKAGATPHKEILTYCEHGTRSSQAVFTLRLVGYEKARLFDGGWMAWGSREDLPIEL